MIRRFLLLAALVAVPSWMPTRGYAFYHGEGVSYVNAMMKGDDIELQRFELVPVTKEIARKLKGPDGDYRTITQKITVWESRAVHEKVLASKVRAFDHEGKKVDAKALEGRLEKMTPVLTSQDARPADPAYFTMLKRGALVLVLPKMQYSAPIPAPPGTKPAVEDVSFDEDDPPAKKGPHGLPPQLASASIDDKGMISIQESFGGSEPMEMEIEVNKDGVKEKRKIVVKTTFFSMNKRSLEAKWVKAHDATGKDISAKNLSARLAKHTNLLVSVDGKEVDPYYLQLYKEGTVVLMPPALGYYGGGYTDAPPPAVEPKTDGEFPQPKKLPAPKIEAPTSIEKFPAPKKVPEKLPSPAAQEVPEVGERESWSGETRSASRYCACDLRAHAGACRQ
jgi:hypothetical protein